MSLTKYQKQRAIRDETNLEKLFNTQTLNGQSIYTMSLSSHKSGDIILPHYLTVIEVKSPEAATSFNPTYRENYLNQYYNLLEMQEHGMHTYYGIHFTWWEFFEVRGNPYKMKESEGIRFTDYLKLLETFYLRPLNSTI